MILLEKMVEQRRKKHKLARPGDPLVALSGEVVQPERKNGEEEKVPVLNSKIFKPTKRRSIKDLPAQVGTINGVACVFMYTMLGLGDREIAEALKITVVDVKAIRNHSAYNECFDVVTGEFINVNAEAVTARIAAYSHEALTTLADITFNGKQEVNRLRGSIDLLDRAGHAPKDAISRVKGGDNALRIVLIDGDKKVGVEISGVAVS